MVIGLLGFPTAAMIDALAATDARVVLGDPAVLLRVVLGLDDDHVGAGAPDVHVLLDRQRVLAVMPAAFDVRPGHTNTVSPGRSRIDRGLNRLVVCLRAGRSCLSSALRGRRRKSCAASRPRSLVRRRRTRASRASPRMPRTGSDASRSTSSKVEPADFAAQRVRARRHLVAETKAGVFQVTPRSASVGRFLRTMDAGPRRRDTTPMDDDNGLGFAFWAKMAGVVIAIGIAGLILMLIFTSAVYASGSSAHSSPSRPSCS